LSLILFIALAPAFTVDAAGADPSDAEPVATLRMQLLEVQAKEAELQVRASAGRSTYAGASKSFPGKTSQNNFHAER